MRAQAQAQAPGGGPRQGISGPRAICGREGDCRIKLDKGLILSNLSPHNAPTLYLLDYRILPRDSIHLIRAVGPNRGFVKEGGARICERVGCRYKRGLAGGAAEHWVLLPRDTLVNDICHFGLIKYCKGGKRNATLAAAKQVGEIQCFGQSFGVASQTARLRIKASKLRIVQ